MRAFVYSDWGVVELKDVARPVCRDREALIRVEACGICGSELESFKSKSERRRPPLILGHEFCGVIESIEGDDSGLCVGQRVVVNSVISCGNCLPCLRGENNLCENREVFGMDRQGALAEFVAAPIECIYPRPESLDQLRGALVEPLANAVHMMGLMPKKESPKVAVIGAGTIGLMMIQAAMVLEGAEVLLADINEDRLKEAEALGVKAAVNPKRVDLVKACRRFSKGDGVDFCIDAVGTAQTKMQSIRGVRPGGTAGWIGLHDNQMSLSSYDLVLAERKVVGSYSASRKDFEKAMDLLDTGRVKGGEWVKVFSLEESTVAFMRMLNAKGNDIKAVIVLGR